MPINTASLGFEKEIWSAADKLRGNVDASEYKHVVLGLIFLKYISDSFEEKHDELKEEIKIFGKTNIVKAEEFSKRMRDIMKKYRKTN